MDQATLLLLSKTALKTLRLAGRRSLWFCGVPGSAEDVELSNSLFVLEALQLMGVYVRAPAWQKVSLEDILLLP